MKLLNTNKNIELTFSTDELEESKFLKTIIALNIFGVNNLSENAIERELNNFNYKSYNTDASNKYTSEDDYININKESINKDEYFKVNESLTKGADGRLPNSLANIENKFSEAVIKEHFDNKNAEMVNLSDVNLKQQNTTIMKNFMCPGCNQSSLAVFKNNEDKLLNGFNTIVSLEDNNKNILCVLSIDIAFEIYKLIEKGLDGEEIIKFVFKELIKDNSNLIQELVDINIRFDDETLNKTIIQCPCCKDKYNASEWIEACNLFESDNKCRYCGSDRFLDFVNSGELKCENNECYSNNSNKE